jgi:hypothetical protein
VDRLATGDRQHNAGMLDLEPSQMPGPGDRLQDREIGGSDDQRAGFTATHGTTSDAGVGLNLQHTAPLNFLHYLWPGPLGIIFVRDLIVGNKSSFKRKKAGRALGVASNC